MELFDLKVLIAVAEHGSISKAAAALQMAQPSVSQRILHLEDEVRQKLFERHRRGVLLTPAGTILLNHARRSLDILADGMEVLQRNVTSGLHIRITGPASVNGYMLAPLVDELVRSGHSVHLHDAHSYDVLQSILDGNCDAGFILSERPIPPGLRATVVWREPILAIAAASHPLAAHVDRLPISALSAEALVQYRFSSEVERFWQALTTRIGEEALPVVSAAPVESAKALVATGRYVGFLPRATVSLDLATGRMVQLSVDGLPEAAWQVSVVVRDRKHQTPATEAVLQALTGIV